MMSGTGSDDATAAKQLEEIFRSSMLHLLKPGRFFMVKPSVTFRGDSTGDDSLADLSRDELKRAALDAGAGEVAFEPSPPPTSTRRSDYTRRVT